MGLDGIVVKAKVCKVRGPGFDSSKHFTFFFAGRKVFVQVFFSDGNILYLTALPNLAFEVIQ